jgi:hypothetical protein
MKGANGSSLIAAAILAARKLSSFDRGKRVPATVAAITDAVRWAEAILKEIDERLATSNRTRKTWRTYTVSTTKWQLTYIVTLRL